MMNSLLESLTAVDMHISIIAVLNARLVNLLAKISYRLLVNANVIYVKYVLTYAFLFYD
jgi:hypothetical protein